jgi:hypothetical protein
MLCTTIRRGVSYRVGCCKQDRTTHTKASRPDVPLSSDCVLRREIETVHLGNITLLTLMLENAVDSITELVFPRM